MDSSVTLAAEQLNRRLSGAWTPAGATIPAAHNFYRS